LWVDAESTAEIATTQVAALKIGVTVVLLDEQDTVHDLSKTLKTSGAKGLVFSPGTVDEKSKEKRANELFKLIPELGGLLPGDEFKTALFPKLQTLIHTGHKTIRGTSKFKESMLYAKKENTSLRVPGTDANTVAFECFKGGEQLKSYTNQDLVSYAGKIASTHYTLDPLSPIYMSLSFTYPLGFAAFLAAASSG